MRSMFSRAAALAMVVALVPVTVSAAPPARASSEQSGVLCEFETELGDVLVMIQDFDGSTFANVLMWAPGAGPDDAPIVASFDGTASLTPTSVEARLELGTIPTDEAPEVERIGTATLTGTLSESGDPQDIGSRVIRDGNRRIDFEITSQLWSVSGTLTIDLLEAGSVTLSLETCGAGIVVQSTFATNPNAYITATEQLYVSCSWITDRGSVDLLAIVDDIDVLTQVVIFEGDRVALAFADPSLTEESFAATYELFDPIAGGSVGTAVADADLAPTGDRITDVDWFDPYRFSVIGERLAVDGTLTINLDGTSTQLPMDDQSCEAGDVRVQVMEKIARP
jgi:cytoskeletal protein CcmA (bactofilin family)